jgi:glycosyltransferase involved in cell wall biosynthesis
MFRYSVIIPQQERGDEVRRQLPALAAALDQFAKPYEIIVVDDGSAHATLRLLEKLLSDFPSLRLLRLDDPVGVSVALTAGVRAARGEVLIAIEPGDAYPPHQISKFIDGLQRADFMAGRRRQVGLAKLWHRITRLPRWLLLGLDGHDPDCLFWAARREVLADITLSPGTARYLPALIARRGFRACETYVDYRGNWRPLQDVHSSAGDLLAAWWHCRRWCNSAAYELTAGRAAQPLLRIVAAQETSNSSDEVAADTAPAIRFDHAEPKPAGLHYPPVVKHA